MTRLDVFVFNLAVKNMLMGIGRELSVVEENDLRSRMLSTFTKSDYLLQAAKVAHGWQFVPLIVFAVGGLTNLLGIAGIWCMVGYLSFFVDLYATEIHFALAAFLTLACVWATLRGCK